MHLYAHTDDTYTPVGIRPHTSLHRHVFTLDWLHGANKEKNALLSQGCYHHEIDLHYPQVCIKLCCDVFN